MKSIVEDLYFQYIYYRHCMGSRGVTCMENVKILLSTGAHNNIITVTVALSAR
jgi:hypothetical protein